jgi:hypothetical protein
MDDVHDRVQQEEQEDSCDTTVMLPTSATNNKSKTVFSFLLRVSD